MGVREEIIVEENEETVEKEEVKKVPPDGGWGFVIILAYGLANAIVIPVLQTFGLIFNDKFTEMQMSATDSAMIVNVASAVGMGMGLFNGPLLRIYGYRKVSVASGVFFSIGLILTSWASTFTHFIITYSILTAIGFGMATSGFSLALNSFFVARRNKAVGIAITITGLGPIFFPQFVTHLLTNYGVQGCVMIIGAFSLHIVLAGLLLQPIKWHMVEAKHEPPAKEIELQPLPPMKAEGNHLRFDSKRSSISSYHTVEAKTDSLPRRGVPEKKEEVWEFSSDDEEMYLEFPYRRISIDHNADIQSIYGFEVIHPMKPNLDRQCSSKTSELLGFKKSATFADLERVRSDMGSPPPSPGPLSAVPKKRWFETGSLDTVNLGSSMKIFDEKYHDPRRSHPGSRRGSCVRITEEGENGEEKALTNGKNKSPKKTYNRVISTDSYYANLPIRKPLKKRCRRQLRRVAKFFDFDLLRDPIYVNMMLGMSIAVFAELNFSLFTPFILADMKFTTEEIASVMSLLAISDIIFRFLAPFIGDYFQQSSRQMYMYSLVMLIMGRSCVPFASTHSVMLGVGFFLGVAKGVRSVYMSLVIPNYVSIERLASASGIQMVTNGVLLLTIGPLMGVIRDLSGSYAMCIIFINLVTATTLIMWTAEMIYLRYRRKASTSSQEEHPEAIEKK